MSIEYILVGENEDDELIEVPTEEDGTVLLSSVAAQFAGCCGLKYRPSPGNKYRGVRLVDERLFPPSEGWSDHRYICTFPRSRSPEAKQKPRCSDLIVLGLPWKTTEEAVKDYFKQYGDIVMVQIKKDPKTGLSKGFGFVKFAEFEAQEGALATRHKIDGRWCDVRIPNSKDGLAPRPPGKVFVGRCTESIGPEDLKDYFGTFGQVTDVFVPRPFRAFGFVTFLDPEVARSLCGQDHIIKGVSVNVSTASPKRDARRPPLAPPTAGYGPWGGRGPLVLLEPTARPYWVESYSDKPYLN